MTKLTYTGSRAIADVILLSLSTLCKFHYENQIVHSPSLWLPATVLPV